MIGHMAGQMGSGEFGGDIPTLEYRKQTQFITKMWQTGSTFITALHSSLKQMCFFDHYFDFLDKSRNCSYHIYIASYYSYEETLVINKKDASFPLTGGMFYKQET